MITYVIVVNDNGSMQTITEQQVDKAFPESSFPTDVLFVINAVLDKRQEELVTAFAPLQERADEEGWEA